MLEKGTYIENESGAWHAFKKKYLDKSFLEKIGLKHRSTGSKIKQYFRNNAGRIAARAAGAVAGSYALNKVGRKLTNDHKNFEIPGALGGAELGEYLYAKATGRRYNDID